jgi:hypothetical protein
MRFEIGPGGGIVILMGLLGLSAAVFVLGMISEHQMEQGEQGQSQVASVYPMPTGAPSASPPQAALPVEPPAAPVVAATVKAPSRSPAASENVPAAALPKPLPGPKAPPNLALVSVPPAPRSAPAAEKPNDFSASTASSASSYKTDTVPNQGAAASAPTASAGTHRHDYKIEIDAIDRIAADRMVSRLLGLGYSAHVVSSEDDGQTWYQVQVGPFRTSAAARAAQANLQAAYTARYENRSGTGNTSAAGAAASKGTASAGSTDTDTTETGAADTDSDDRGGGDSAPSAPTN